MPSVNSLQPAVLPGFDDFELQPSLLELEDMGPVQLALRMAA
jgi:hypothetical protein